nr:RNA-directed DNA polymerase, eukaryota, reverse transcriptase zinc-binding domain protein [Tanacetum cinerariifolium]
MEDMIRVGKAMGYSMDGYVKDLEQIIGHKELVSRKWILWDYVLTLIDRWNGEISLEGFDAMVEQTWRSFSHNDANRMIHFKKKIQDLKVRIQAWIKDKRSSVSGEKDFIKKELSDIDRLLDGGMFSTLICFRATSKYWNLVGSNLCDAVENLFETRSFLNRCNSSFVALIPKITDAKFVNDFRPISLIGSVYKVVTNVLANWLALVILDLISDTQSAFVANRQILDGPFILNELLHWCKRKKKQVMFLKVDFVKAYDSVRWDYLLDVLEAFGFDNIWCKWIRGTFSFAKASVLVNGSPTIEFPFYCRLKQGDPLSPYLFILIMESLNMSFTCAIDEGVFKGV